MTPSVAFHAPMKPPDHPTPSGDRRIARLTQEALSRAGFAPFLASSLRTLDMAGDPALQSRLLHEARAEADRLIRALRPDPPALWFTYHCYWKAPDLLGPTVSRALGIPYAISEPILSPRRREGPWAAFAEAAETAIRAADVLLWSTPRDLPALEGLATLAPLPPFLDAGPPPPPRPAPDGPLRLLAVAMMRPGAKLASYAALAGALRRLPDLPFRLDIVGDGTARAEVERLFEGLPAAFHGALHDPAAVLAAYAGAELLTWPGVDEGFGMTYLEAQAAALPALCEDRPGPRDVVLPPVPLPPPGDPAAYAAAIRLAASDRAALAEAGLRARAHVEGRHSLDAAAATLRRLPTLLPR